MTADHPLGRKYVGRHRGDERTARTQQGERERRDRLAIAIGLNFAGAQFIWSPGPLARAFSRR